MRRSYVVAGFALVAAIALVGSAVAGIGGTGDRQDVKSSAKKKGPRGPRGPAGPAGPQGPPGPPGSSAAFSNAAAFASVGPTTNELGTTFEDLVTIPPTDLTTSAANSVVIGTGSVQIAEVGTPLPADVECQIVIDSDPVGVSVTERLDVDIAVRTVTVSQGAQVGPGSHSVSMACRNISGGGTTLNFEQGNITATATG
jgi:hypothetical protein